MSSRSESPSITQFFKAQRKRPRTGKEDVSVAKKVLLEKSETLTSPAAAVSLPPPAATPAPPKRTGVPGKKGNERPSSSKSKTVGDSPVKFLKLGPLSPGKKKKMTAEQVAKVLKKRKKLSDLKNALEGINQCSKKLDEFRRTVADANTNIQSPVRKTDNTVKRSERSKQSSSKAIPASQFYSPTADHVLKDDLGRLSATKFPASPSKLININHKVKKRLFEEKASTKEVDKKVPAYQRFHNLAQKTAPEKGIIPEDELDLPLPYHFKVLKELFVGVETVLGIMRGRKEITTFPNVKAAVVKLVRKISLREKHLAQMVTVLPGCYTFDLEKVGKDTHIKIIVEDLLPSVICARQKAFHAALIAICLEHHKKFLLDLVPPIVVPADKQITRWHPNFKVDEIPDIVPKDNALPTKPEPEKICSAREVIAKAQNLLEHGNPRLKKAMKNMLNNSEAEAGGLQQIFTPKALRKPIPKLREMRGVSKSLLEKIQNHEKQKILNQMTRSVAEIKKLEMMKQLPNFIKIIRNMMVAEKKVALAMDVVIDRLRHSIPNISAEDTATHIHLLVVLLPRWAKLCKVSRSDKEYLRVDKNIDINDLLQEMDDIIKKHAK